MTLQIVLQTHDQHLAERVTSGFVTSETKGTRCSLVGDTDQVIQELRTCRTVDGLTMADVLGLPDSVRALVNRLIREQPSNYMEMIDALQCDASEAQRLIDLLVEKGYVRQEPNGEQIDTEPSYHVELSPVRGRTIDQDLL